MAFNVIFYTFAKKDNSTAVPASGGTTYSCTLKDGCSITSPVIKLNLGPSSGDPIAYNYCYISSFNRYYFVSDWTSDKGMWYGSLNVDVLASFKTAIGNSSEMIVRAASEYDGRINDVLYPVINNQIWYSRSGSTTPWWPGQRWMHRDPMLDPGPDYQISDDGEFIVGLKAYVGANSVQGGINYAGFTTSGFKDFMNSVYCGGQAAVGVISFLQDKADVFKVLLPTLNNEQALNLAYVCDDPFSKYIDSITYIPKTPDFVTFDYADLYLGPDVVGLHYRVVDPKTTTDVTWSTSSIPKHPQESARGSFLNMDPYSEYMLELPRAGIVPIDSSLLADYDTLTVDLSIDVVTGQGLYTISVGDGSTVKQSIAKIYVPIGVTIKVMEGKGAGTMLAQLGSLVSSVESRSPGSLISTIASIHRERKTPGSGTIGEAGGYGGLYPGYPILYSHHFYVSDEDNTHNGRPLMRVRTINTLSGFVQCQHGDIDIGCTDTERASIRSYMERGFFYE